MRNYLLNVDGKGSIVQMQGSDTSEYYGEVQTKFEKEQGKDQFSWVNMQSLWEDQKIDSMYYNYDLSCNGGHYGLYCFNGETKDQIAKAKAYLRHNFDVVSLQVHKIKIVPFVMPEKVVV